MSHITQSNVQKVKYYHFSKPPITKIRSFKNCSLAFGQSQYSVLLKPTTRKKLFGDVAAAKFYTNTNNSCAPTSQA